MRDLLYSLLYTFLAPPPSHPTHCSLLQAGGAITGTTATILETSSYYVCIVLIFFFLLTLSFEYAVHFTKEWLLRKGREGLAQAVEKVVLEITLLGFVSLILLLFEQYMPSFCVSYNPESIDWTLLDNVNACPCCLQSTYGVTTCAQMYHQCGYNITTQAPYCGCEVPGVSYSSYDSDRNASDPLIECTSYEINEQIFVVEEFLSSAHQWMSELNVTARDFCTALVGNGEQWAASPSPVPSAMALPPPMMALQEEQHQQGRRRHLLGGSSSSTSTDSNSTGTTSSAVYDGVNNTHIIPEIQSFRCEGPFYAANCPEGSHPAISNEALHEIHVMVFLIACTHVASAIIVVVLALARMQQWRRWQSSAPTGFEPKRLAAMLSAEFEISNGKGRKGGVGGRRGYAGRQGAGDDIEHQHEEDVGEVVEVDPERQEKRVNGDKAPRSIRSSTSIIPMEEEETPPLQQQQQQSEEEEASPEWKARLQMVKESFRRKWGHRDTKIIHHHSFLAESFICIAQSFLPNLISRDEFLTMRSAYIASFNLPADFDFVEETRLHLDFDVVHIIGASVAVWIVVILLWLLMGLVEWANLVFLLLAAVALFAINLRLVISIRYSCRGGRPHRVRNAFQWWKSARWLATPISAIIMVCSMVFSNAIFFAWLFGSNSCFFSDSVYIWRWAPGSLPFWTGFLPPAIMLAWLSGITVPAWALVLHMRPYATEGSVHTLPHSASVASSVDATTATASVGVGIAAGPSKHTFVGGWEGRESEEGVGVTSAPTAFHTTSRKYRTQAELVSKINSLRQELMDMQRM